MYFLPRIHKKRAGKGSFFIILSFLLLTSEFGVCYNIFIAGNCLRRPVCNHFLREKGMEKGSVAVLDVRSDTVTVFVGKKGVNNTFELKAMNSEPYGGYRYGEFYDVEDLRKATLKALGAVEQVLGESLKQITVGVPGEFIKVIPREKEIDFNKRRKIGIKEIELLEESGKEELAGHRLIRVTSMIYVTGDNRRVVDPCGIVSSRLSGKLSYFYCTNYFAEAVERVFEGRKFKISYLPTTFITASYLIPPETRDECALFLDIGFLSSTLLVVLGGGVPLERTFSVGRADIIVSLLKALNLPYDATAALLNDANLFVTGDVKTRYFDYGGASYEVDIALMNEAIKNGLDELWASFTPVLEEWSASEITNLPIYVSGGGLEGIRGAREYMSKRLNRILEEVKPDLAFYNKPSMSSRIALMDAACEDNRKSGFLYRLLNGGF